MGEPASWKSRMLGASIVAMLGFAGAGTCEARPARAVGDFSWGMSQFFGGGMRVALHGIEHNGNALDLVVSAQLAAAAVATGNDVHVYAERNVATLDELGTFDVELASGRPRKVWGAVRFLLATHGENGLESKGMPQWQRIASQPNFHAHVANWQDRSRHDNQDFMQHVRSGAIGVHAAGWSHAICEVPLLDAVTCPEISFDIQKDWCHSTKGFTLAEQRAAWSLLAQLEKLAKSAPAGEVHELEPFVVLTDEVRFVSLDKITAHMRSLGYAAMTFPVTGPAASRTNATAVAYQPASRLEEMKRIRDASGGRARLDCEGLPGCEEPLPPANVMGAAKHARPADELR